MATIKTRINITADADVESVLRRLAKREGVPIATKAAEFLRLAIELNEDFTLSDIADERLKKPRRFIKHEKAWSKL